MEETLALQSERDFLRAVEDNSQFLLTTFTQRHRRFDGERVTQKLVQLLYLMETLPGLKLVQISFFFLKPQWLHVMEKRSIDWTQLVFISPSPVYQVSSIEWQLIKNLFRISCCTVPLRWSDICGTKLTLTAKSIALHTYCKDPSMIHIYV